MNDSFAGYKILIQHYFLSECDDITPCKTSVTDGNKIFIDNSPNYKDLLSMKAFRIFILNVLKYNHDMYYHAQHSDILL